MNISTHYNIVDIIPVYKKGDQCVLDNFRPISLGDCMWKIIEASFLQNINFDKIISCYQHA